MIDVNVIKLEDNLDYVIIDTLANKENQYFFLAQELDENNVCVRKVIKEEGKEFLVKLDNEEEFLEVLKLFNSKHNKRGMNDEK